MNRNFKYIIPSSLSFAGAEVFAYSFYAAMAQSLSWSLHGLSKINPRFGVFESSGWESGATSTAYLNPIVPWFTQK